MLWFVNGCELRGIWFQKGPTSFCSTCRVVFNTSRNWDSCLRSSSCTCLIWTHNSSGFWAEGFVKVKMRIDMEIRGVSQYKAGMSVFQLWKISHRVQVCGEFLYWGFEVVHCFETILKEARTEDIMLVNFQVIKHTLHFSWRRDKNNTGTTLVFEENITGIFSI